MLGKINKFVRFLNIENEYNMKHDDLSSHYVLSTHIKHMDMNTSHHRFTPRERVIIIAGFVINYCSGADVARECFEKRADADVLMCCSANKPQGQHQQID